MREAAGPHVYCIGYFGFKGLKKTAADRGGGGGKKFTKVIRLPANHWSEKFDTIFRRKRPRISRQTNRKNIRTNTWPDDTVTSLCAFARVEFPLCNGFRTRVARPKLETLRFHRSVTKAIVIILIRSFTIDILG